MTQSKSIPTAALPEAALLKNPVVARPMLKQSMAKHPLFPNETSGDCLSADQAGRTYPTRRGRRPIYSQLIKETKIATIKSTKLYFVWVSEALP
jgi:hypothetical protein